MNRRGFFKSIAALVVAGPAVAKAAPKVLATIKAGNITSRSLYGLPYYHDDSAGIWLGIVRRDHAQYHPERILRASKTITFNTPEKLAERFGCSNMAQKLAERPERTNEPKYATLSQTRKLSPSRPHRRRGRS